MTIKNIDYDKFIRIINELYDEIIIYDNNYKIVFVNSACERHYGLLAEEMIGQYFADFKGEYWNKSVLPYVYRTKKTVCQCQETKLGEKITTIAAPLLDENDEIEYVCMSVRDEINEDFNEGIYPINEQIKDEEFETTDIIYKSQEMEEVLSIANKILNIDSPCLITGESGVGKTLIGKYIHNNSDRKNKPFIHVNCAAINKELFESELYGYGKNAFTGANKEGKDGLAFAANGGTLFLDEIAEIPYEMQAKLLHFIQEKNFYPVGSTKKISVEVNIIAATNKDLKKMVELAEFREDLYYRLNVFEIFIPPLRERKDDILILAQFYLNEYNKKYGKTNKFSKEVKDIFVNHIWRGNTRELSHIIERLVIISKNRIIKTSDLPKSFFDLASQKVEECKVIENDFDKMVEEYEGKIIRKAYEETGSSRKLAKKLNISQSKASRLIRKHTES